MIALLGMLMPKDLIKYPTEVAEFQEKMQVNLHRAGRPKIHLASEVALLNPGARRSAKYSALARKPSASPRRIATGVQGAVKYQPGCSIILLPLPKGLQKCLWSLGRKRRRPWGN